MKQVNGDHAINLGDTINTVYNEDTPFITLNDSILYFSSEGHSGMGGYDIFRSWRSNQTWDAPQNLGFPVNSTDDDRFFQPFNNHENGFYSIVTDYKKKEIFYLTLTTPRLERIFEIKEITASRILLLYLTRIIQFILLTKQSRILLKSDIRKGKAEITIFW